MVGLNKRIKNDAWRRILCGRYVLRGTMQKLLFTLLATLSINTFASSQSCIKKYAAYTEVQEAWQNESTALVVNVLPQHSELANYYRGVQLAAINRRNLAVQLALQHFPNNVNTDSKLNQWIDYSPELEATLSKKSSSFKLAVQKYQKIKNKPQSENGDQFRKAFREIVTQSKEFQDLLSAFNSKVKELNTVKCTKNITR